MSDSEQVQPGAPAGRIVTFGEAMIRLTPPGYERLERTERLDVTVGGAELNTAVACTCLGMSSRWVSALPDTAPGRLIARAARANGVDTSGIRWVDGDAGRTGLYFLEEGVDPRPSAVTYDRKDTAMARLQRGAFAWDELLADAAVFHVSGITQALSDGARAEAMTAAQTARAQGIPVSFDLNYRSKLWSEAEARAVFREIMPHVDILFASREGLQTFFGIGGTYEEVLREAVRTLGVQVVTLTRKESQGARQLRIMSMALGPSGDVVTSDWQPIEVVDRLGGGDAYAAGFLAGYLRQPGQPERAVALGNAASALKHTMPGDLLCTTREEVEAVVAGTSGVLLR